jgi:hypothetical protein
MFLVERLSGRRSDFASLFETPKASPCAKAFEDKSAFGGRPKGPSKRSPGFSLGLASLKASGLKDR